MEFFLKHEQALCLFSGSVLLSTVFSVYMASDILRRRDVSPIKSSAENASASQTCRWSLAGTFSSDSSHEKKFACATRTSMFSQYSTATVQFDLMPSHVKRCNNVPIFRSFSPFVWLQFSPLHADTGKDRSASSWSSLHQSGTYIQ